MVVTQLGKAVSVEQSMGAASFFLPTTKALMDALPPKEMKTPKTLRIRNDRTLSKGFVTLPNAALADAYAKEKPVVAYIKGFNGESDVAIIWRTRSDLEQALIKKEWLPHECGYEGMDKKKNGYYLSQMRVPFGSLKAVSALPKYVQNAIEKHQRRTGGAK